MTSQCSHSGEDVDAGGISGSHSEQYEDEDGCLLDCKAI